MKTYRSLDPQGQGRAALVFGVIAETPPGTAIQPRNRRRTEEKDGPVRGCYTGGGAAGRPYPECLGLRAQPTGAHLHDGVGAEGDAHLVLADRRQPQGHVALQLQRGHQDGLVTRVHAAGTHGTEEAPR